jgi:lipoprotein NlpI
MMLIVILTLSWATARRSLVWRDSVSLWQDAIRYYRQAVNINPGCAEVYNNIGVAYANQGKMDSAIIHFNKAIENKPDYLA